MDARSNLFLADFNAEGREKLLSRMIEENYPAGTILFNEGDAADGVCLVVDGEVEIIRKASEGEEVVLRRFGPGDFFGEVAVLDGFGRSTGARASGPVRIAKIPREPLLETLASEPAAITIKLFQHVLGHLRKTNDLYISEVVHKEKLGLVGEMASSLMHDLRNPVAGIRLAADLIGMNHQDEETLHCCNGIRMQCDRIVIMATELLEFSRGESKLYPSKTSTVAFLQQFRQLNEPLFENCGVEVTADADEAPIEIDSLRMVRVLQNLVSNAVDAIGQRTDGTVKIRTWVQNGIFSLEVRDNGPGIPEHLRARIYDPFVTHGKKGGTGLGMAIVKNIVTAHGGTISFDTEMGEGTTFLIQLPQ